VFLILGDKLPDIVMGALRHYDNRPGLHCERKKAARAETSRSPGAAESSPLSFVERLILHAFRYETSFLTIPGHYESGVAFEWSDVQFFSESLPTSPAFGESNQQMPEETKPITVDTPYPTPKDNNTAVTTPIGLTPCGTTDCDAT
jgi:hypothetical protein